MSEHRDLIAALKCACETYRTHTQGVLDAFDLYIWQIENGQFVAKDRHSVLFIAKVIMRRLKHLKAGHEYADLQRVYQNVIVPLMKIIE